MGLQQCHWAMIPYGIPFSKRFCLYSAALFTNCKLLNPENIGGYHQINKIGEFLEFSSKRKGIRAWNFRMMIRKIWRFLWYQNHNNFEKNEKRKDQAPLSLSIHDLKNVYTCKWNLNKIVWSKLHKILSFWQKTRFLKLLTKCWCCFGKCFCSWNNCLIC